MKRLLSQSLTRRAIALFAGLWLGGFICAQQQEISILTEAPQPIADSLANRWQVHLDLTTFMRDAEFSLPYTRGYTVLGFFADPTARYQIGTVGRATLGLHLASAAGYEGLHTWQPLVRLEYIPSDNFRIVMGTLYGNLAHGLYEPMLDRERYIYAHQEEGMQILARTAHWSTDTWLHWENLLEPWQADQERFTMGSSNVIHFEWNKFGISFPLSFLGSHRGGQFSTLDTCIQSLFTESVGLQLQLNIRHSTLRLEAPFFFYQDISPVKCMAFDNGHGFWPQLSYEYRNLSWHLIANGGYWIGNQFIAPRGSYLFQGVSWHRKDIADAERRMATFRLALEKRLTSNFLIGADSEAYSDFTRGGTDIVFALYLRFTPTWNL